MNWMEGNSLFTWMTRALLPEYRAPKRPGVAAAAPGEIPHGDEATNLALETLRLYPVDRVLRPVMNSLRADLERNTFSRGEALSAHPIPIHQRPLDNEYVWKGNPYHLDGWLKPTVTRFQFACDDPLVAWFVTAQTVVHDARRLPDLARQTAVCAARVCKTSSPPVNAPSSCTRRQIKVCS
jgi:hypothetical protein